MWNGRDSCILRDLHLWTFKLPIYQRHCVSLIIFLPKAEMLIRKRQIIGLKVTLPKGSPRETGLCYATFKNADPTGSAFRMSKGVKYENTPARLKLRILESYCDVSLQMPYILNTTKPTQQLQYPHCDANHTMDDSNIK